MCPPPWCLQPPGHRPSWAVEPGRPPPGLHGVCWVGILIGLAFVDPTNVPSPVFAQEPIRLRYKLTFNQGGQPFSEVGEVKDFPDLAVLGAA